jgi:VanZ family protein
VRERSPVLLLQIAGLAAVTGVITLLSLMQGPAVQKAVIVTDKFSHMAGYAALGFFAAPVVRHMFRSRPVSTLAADVLALLYAAALGGILELLQQYTGRQPELADLAADAVGGLLGIAVYRLASALYRRRPGARPSLRKRDNH